MLWPFYSRRKRPQIHIGWMGPRTDLDDVKEKSNSPLPRLKLQRLSHPTCSQFLTYSDITGISAINQAFLQHLLVIQRFKKFLAVEIEC
jgi:hypothetical protein